MLSNIQKNIITRAAHIRMQKGEELEEILASYTKLTEEDKEEIIGMIPQKAKTVAAEATLDEHQAMVENIRQRVASGEDLKTIIASLDLTDEEKWKLEAEVKEG